MTETSPNQPPIAETVDVEILAASIAGPGTVTVSIRVEGSFERPGNAVEIAPVVIVATIPAVVLPR